jgi:hypothetical protein
MNLSDTFYVALCMTVLIIGVVYWFWTQNQYIQRKLNLLENIVYDMKSSMNFSGGGPPDHVEKALAAAASQEHHAVPETIAPLSDEIVDDDDVDKILSSMATHEISDETAAAAAHDISGNSGPSLVMEDIGTSIVADEHLDDLQPGGIIGIDTDVSDTSNESVLNAMGLKELRELAKQKNIAGSKTLRKHELVAAIRASKTNVTPFEIREGTLDLN